MEETKEDMVDEKTLMDFLAKTASSFFNIDEKILYTSLQDDKRKMQSFIEDGHARRMLIRRNEGGAEGKTPTFTVMMDVQAFQDSFSILFIKSFPTIKSSVPLPEQLYSCKVKDGAPYEAMLNYIRHAFLPYSRLVLSSDKDADSKDTEINVLRAVNSKLSELEVSLLRCQQNIEIPQIQLQIHPVIRDVLAKTNGAKPTIEDLPKDLEMDKFLNELANFLADWKKLILGVTKLDRDVSTGSTKEEIHFWGSMERTLSKIEKQLKSPGVEFTMEILNVNKRFLATTGFREDSNLTACQEKVKIYNDLLRDFPIRNLIEAVTMNGLKESLSQIFKHLKHIARLKYPLKRAVALVHTISRDVAFQLKSIVAAKRPMLLSFEDFNKATKDAKDLFRRWDTSLELFNDEVRQYRHRTEDREKLEIGEPYQAMGSLKKRITEIRNLRRNHYQLIRVIERTLEKDSIVRQASLKKIYDAYEFIKGVDAMDTSKEAQEVWMHAMRNYNSKIEYVEGELEEKIRELLDRAKGDANEMFRVCGKFNDLFVRPRIQAAIREYQQPLIETVKEGINKLHEMFKTHYVRSEACKMSTLLDVPPVSGAIIWLRQIENQLLQYMEKVEHVLGKKWHHHLEGKNLKRIFDYFRGKLEKTQKDQFEVWIRSWKRPKTVEMDKQIELEGKIFKIEMVDAQPSLKINFDKKLITLFKEVRNLSYIPNIRVPYEIQIQANEAKVKYPFAVRLEEVVRIYNRTCSSLSKHADLEPLAAKAKKKVQEYMRFGVEEAIHWTSDFLGKFVRKIGSLTQQFQDQVDDIIARHGKIDKAVEQLAVVDPTREALGAVVAEVQNIVDHFEKNGYSNLAMWVVQLDRRLETILAKRLKDLMRLWKDGLDLSFEELEQISKNLPDEKNEAKDDTHNNDDEDEDGLRDSETLELHKNRQLVKMLQEEMKNPIAHDITIKSNVIGVEPPMQHSRLRLCASLQRLLGSICKLPRIQCWATKRNFDGAKMGEREKHEQLTFSSALSKLTTEELQLCYNAIEDKVVEAEQYVSTWFHYQALWDMDVDQALKSVQDDVHAWEALLRDMKISRRGFDGEDYQKHFGPLVIRYRKVQAKVTGKVDSWSKTIINKFAEKLSDMMSTSYHLAMNGRKQLEDLTLDFKDTEQVIANVMALQELKNKSQTWEADMKAQVGVEKMLERQRYLFPQDWLYSERVIGEWTAFQQILNTKLKILSTATPNLQSKITEEDLRLAERLAKFVAEWKEGRPIDGKLDHKKVIKALDLFQSTLEGLEKQLSQMENAKQALGMPVKQDKTLEPIKDELKGLQECWDCLGGIWGKIDLLAEKRFESIAPEKIRGEFKRMQGDLSNMPNHLRSYDAFDFLKKRLIDYQKLYIHFVTISSPVLRKKHQHQILKLLRISKNWELLTIGDLLQADLARHKEELEHIAETAQGESALEEYLASVATTWEDTKFDLVHYQKKCFLIRNWNDMFKQLADHITDLSSMKQSPFYKVFEREAMRWDQTLNLAQAILENFSEVQRRWIYLEGIFLSSVDVQQQLAFQYRRFKSFDGEFVRLMREIKLEPSTLYWFSQERALLPRLENYKEILSTIQKALGAYLEKQRAQFPRFYFVGDDDLLEIIGNAKDPVKVLRHLPKMFAGIASLKLSEDGKGKEIEGMSSREGEIVPFEETIDVKECKSIHDWLRKVEAQMRNTLASQLSASVGAARDIQGSAKPDMKSLAEWVGAGAAQTTLLSAQVAWSDAVSAGLAACDKEGGGNTAKHLSSVLERCKELLKLMAERILSPMKAEVRKKYEQMITEIVHQRDVVRSLIDSGVTSNEAFTWLANLRFEFDEKVETLEEKLTCQIARATFFYGFEYLGVGERLVQTPLTDRCYLTLCEAMHMRMGGNPFGPAGTGKTESVKMLGSQLGRFVLVFCCDESFDLAAMGRIFVGLCQCGAWGCFDEFNRLEERILSAVSQQIQVIQEGLKAKAPSIDLAGKQVTLNPKMGIFVTMNPGYAGRSNLPDNLKQLFRGMAMMKPDRNLIAQVTLYSQGFRTAEFLSSKVVLLFQLCKDQLSSQSHYDFGLRSLKSVLRSAGALKRKDMSEQERGNDADWKKIEQALLVKSMCMTVVPKLISQDLGLFKNLLTAVFPSAALLPPNVEALRKMVIKICEEKNLLPTDQWINKIMELNQVQTINHGLIMVGPSGTGKTTAWSVLLEALERVDSGKVKSECHLIDPKAINKDELYGTLDPTTLEWTNGVFTHILRKIIDDTRGEKRRHWIIFDGDVDPEWAENLNSVLDDNKLLTLPNGERIMLSDNIRVMFEVRDLNAATPATVSRCGMVWFNPEVVSMNMVCSNLLRTLRDEPIRSVADAVYRRWTSVQRKCCNTIKSEMRITQMEDEKDLSTLSDAPSPYIDPIFEYCSKQSHIMPFQRMRVMGTLFSLLAGGIAKVMVYNDAHPDFPLTDGQMENFMKKYVVMAVVWAFGGSMSLRDRSEFCNEMKGLVNTPIPGDAPLIDYDVEVAGQEWEKWEANIPQVELDPEKIPKPDVVIETVDTYRHSRIIGAVVADHRPLILCGPPGSGKSMTLTAVLRRLPNFELVTLNFSSTTDPDLLMKTLNHYCSKARTPKGMVMRPHMQDKWLVIFCDEINLPAADKYGTQPAITFLRQLIEQGGFWDAKELVWVGLERVQIIGACNPPTDAGRVAMTPRFLRHTMLLFVDFPAESSLKIIFGTFNRALVKKHAALNTYAEPLTDAMVEFYLKNQHHFTPDIQPHYIYSPRELIRWVRAMYEAMDSRKLNGRTLLPEDLTRLFAHEALRLFQDRLVDVPEREWADKELDETVHKHFPNVDHERALARPILFSEWLSSRYESVDQEELRKHVLARLHTFNEEELDVKLVVFDEVLAHILRIDRVLRQPLGHLLLVGASGSGKTILSKFVSWMNGMKTFQIKVHKHYTCDNFDEDLRGVLIRSGCKREKICFIFDESNVLDTAFLERMNALLASGEVPGLFEDADYKNLMQECKDMGRKEGEVLGSDEERYKRFCRHVQRNLHVVFTMNPSNEDFDNRSATSPALFNRCVIDWFGEWSEKALYQVGFEFTKSLDLGDLVPGEEKMEGMEGMDMKENMKELGLLQARPGTQRDNVVQTMVYIHSSVQNAMEQLAKARNGRATYVTPRHYLDFIKHYKKLFHEKRQQFEEGQMHLLSGLQKLKETEQQVEEMRIELNKKNIELQKKEKEGREMMNQIQKDSVDAENQKQASLKIKREQEEQNRTIATRRTKVEHDLAQAGPALKEAENAVRGVSQRDLDVVRRFARPPKLVQLAMEPVMMMVTGKKSAAKDWNATRKVLSRSDFIPNVLAFDTRKLDKKVTKEIKNNYLSNPDFTFEKVNRASTACGPLVKWVISQISFSAVLNSVAPMEKELKSLEHKANELKEKGDQITELLENITTKITKFQDEYKVLVSESTRIEDELKRVQGKVDRSVKLLKNLGSEKQRWDTDREEYQKQVQTVVGDTLLSAAFLAYIGYFNQGYRKTLFDMWVDTLNTKSVQTKIDMSIIEYLSAPSQRLEWKAHDLPNDTLCFENAIMMTRYNRYPLIIDPSGQAVHFLMEFFNNNKNSKRKMIRTSFLDNGFLKHLESALRFGNALLVEDVESIDPVLNSVLNREISKSGGRVMITVGAKEIDFSPHFTIFLSTRDPTCHFTPDLCSRVTFVNFTATHASLAAQCLNKVLKSERPDIDNKRSDLLKLQGEFRVQLRELEKALLNALNSVKTNILEDDNVMNTLENLKNKSSVVAEKMADSEKVMEQVTNAAAVYEPFAKLASRIYFTLEELSTSHFLYQFSLPFFLQLVDDLLSPKTNEALEKLSGEGKKKPEFRLKAIRDSMFSSAFLRVARGLLQKDQMAFALRLAQVSLSESHALDYNEVHFLLRVHPTAYGGSGVDLPKPLSLSKPQSIMLEKLVKIPAFGNLASHMSSHAQNWHKFMIGDSSFPEGWESNAGSKVFSAFRKVLVAKVLKAQILEEVSKDFVDAVFGEEFLNQLNDPKLDRLVTVETRAETPILLVTFPGYDASVRVTDLARNHGMESKLTALAMGSPEGFAQADTAINIAAKTGKWVLLKNVHLSPTWLSSLEKRLHRLEPDRNFRIFMTMEVSPRVPLNLVRMSNVVILEPPRGLKSSMMRIFNNLPSSRVNKAPAERSRLYFLLAWLHSVVLERLRYTPVGWTKGFEFSEADQRVALDAIDEWVDKMAKDRLNVRPEHLPWDAIQESLKKIVYGGRLDNVFDQSRLNAFVNKLFLPSAYDVEFPLAHTIDGKEKKMRPLIQIPDCRDYQGFVEWIEKMPDIASPEYLGLPANAKVLLQLEQTKRILNILSKLQSADHDVERASMLQETKIRARSMSSSMPPWWVRVRKLVTYWLKAIPPKVTLLQGTASSALVRTLQREIQRYSHVHSQIMSDLKAASEVFEGNASSTNRVRMVLKAIGETEQVPSHWDAKPVNVTMSASNWMQDFINRIRGINAIAETNVKSIGSKALWLGGLLAPEAFFAASRQEVARAHQCPLDSLFLKVTISNSASALQDDFIFQGLTLHGAGCTSSTLTVTEKVREKLPYAHFQWCRRDKEEKDDDGPPLATLPVYLDESRKVFLFSIKLPFESQFDPDVFSQRGACITVWSPPA